MSRTILENLPSQTHWDICGTSLRFDFTQARFGLIRAEDMIQRRWMEDAWRSLLIFGQEDYADGGGARPWLTVDCRSGAVMGLDLEREDALYLLNSSLDQFIETFKYLNAHLVAPEDLPDDAAPRRLPEDAENVAMKIDPAAYPRSDWRLLIEHVRAQ